MDNRINFLDLKKQYLQIKEEADRALLEVCRSTAFSGGSFVENFENSFAAYCDSKFAIGLNNGTSALHLAMICLDIKEGEEVILPANTFIATAWAPSYVNATPVFVDCDPDTWNIDLTDLEKKITSKTKAIIGVHLYGQPFDIDSVLKIAKKHDIPLVEDCAQATGSRYKGKIIGSSGEMGCYSFYPGKNLGAYGDAGAIVTDNDAYKEHLMALRDHGSVKKYYHSEIGFNMRMSGFNGAVLDIKLKYIDMWNDRRREIAQMYFGGIKNLKIKFQHQPEWTESNYHLFVVTTKKREKLMAHLQDENIFCGMHYPVPCHLQKAYAGLGYKVGDFPNSEYLARNCMTLPMYAELENEEVERVIEAINEY